MALSLNATISEPELASKGGKRRITKPVKCLPCTLESTQEAHKKLLKGFDEEVAQIRRQHEEKTRAAGTFKERFDSLASRSETLESAREQVQRNVAGLWEGMSAQWNGATRSRRGWRGKMGDDPDWGQMDMARGWRC